MVFILKNTTNGNQVCLNYRNQKIGRRSNNDILVKHPSVSKEHALLIPKGDKVIIKDLNSKRGTFVNGKQIKSPRALKSSDRIKLGLMDGGEEIQFLELDWITAASEITEADKKILPKVLKNCRVKIADSWSKKCTHYTTNRIILNEEMLSALVDRKPFVTIRYWFKLEKCIRDNELLPNPRPFFPPLDESLLNSGLDFNFDLRRRFIFEERNFVVFDEEEDCAFVRLIEKCEGTVLFWEKLSKEMQLKILNDPSYLFVNNGSLGKYINPANRKNIFSKKDIFLAIVKCSTRLSPERDNVGDETTDLPKRSNICVSEADSSTPDFLDNLELPVTDVRETAGQSSISFDFRDSEILEDSFTKSPKVIEKNLPQKRKRRKNRSKLVLNPFVKAHSPAKTDNGTKTNLHRMITKKAKNEPKWIGKRVPTDQGKIIDLTEDNSSDSEEQQTGEEMDSFIQKIKTRFKDIEIKLVPTENNSLR